MELGPAKVKLSDYFLLLITPKLRNYPFFQWGGEGTCLTRGPGGPSWPEAPGSPCSP